MNLIVACLVFFLSATQLLAEDMEWTEGSLWPESELNQVDLEEPIYRYRLRFARKPNPERFYAPMGKRNKDDIELNRPSPKRHNPASFIGLMGKRSLGSETTDVSNRYTLHQMTGINLNSGALEQSVSRFQRKMQGAFK